MSDCRQNDCSSNEVRNFMTDNKHKNKKSRLILKIIFFTILILIILLGVSVYLSANWLTVTYYTIAEDVTESIRIVQLTDLHNSRFGQDNQKLVRKVSEQQPDLIFITGDMINQDEENTEILCTLLEQLTAIAPVYYGFGNHERNWECGTQKELKDKIAQTGAIVLDCEYKDVTVKGQELRIGGYYGYYRQPGMLTKSEAQREKELAFADEFEDTDRIKILLCHIPTAWLDWEYIDKFPVDLVFCGHYHGGQIRLPLIGGLYAPNVGWFPEYTKGIFQGSEATCVLSAGLGNETWVPRVNNLPEIVVADLVKENP